MCYPARGWRSSHDPLCLHNSVKSFHLHSARATKRPVIYDSWLLYYVSMNTEVQPNFSPAWAGWWQCETNQVNIQQTYCSLLTVHLTALRQLSKSPTRLAQLWSPTLDTDNIGNLMAVALAASANYKANPFPVNNCYSTFCVLLFLLCLMRIKGLECNSGAW